jgi:hypothetical protein
MGDYRGAPPKGREPFQFAAASYVFRIQREEATNLLELQKGIEPCTDASIFYHTSQSLGLHHFLTEDFPTILPSGC